MRRTTALLSASALALAGAMIAGPVSAAEGDLKLSSDSVTLGADVTVTATLAGCEETDFGGIFLFAPGADIDEDDPIAESDDLDINADGELFGTFTVPANAPAGDATVAAFCGLEDSEVEQNSDTATLKLVAAATPETPVAEPAKPVVQKPAFTG
jgi:hypothetical protein